MWKDPGLRKWISLVVYITILEILPGETLSQAHFRAVNAPNGGMRLKTRLPILALHGYVVAHLWGFTSDRWDPLTRLTLLMKRK